MDVSEEVEIMGLLLQIKVLYVRTYINCGTAAVNKGFVHGYI